MAREDDSAEAAYQKALARIEKVRKAGETRINFDDAPFRALDRIPPEITGIEGLVYLDLGKTRVHDLTPIRGLTGLQTLWLNQTRVSDLTALAGLTWLHRLSLDQTGVNDLTALAGLTELEYLSLTQTGVSDLTALAGLTWLETLWLDQTGVSDVTALAGLTGLRTLSLSQTGVSDLTALAGLTGLQTLTLTQTGVSDLTALAGLTGLQTLSLSQTGVSDLTALSGLTGLQTLSLTQTGVSDLTALAGLTGLRTLSLTQTGVSDLRPLRQMSKLGERPLSGLWFADTPAVRLDSTLARLDGIKDPQQRARDTVAYLNTLPPWPAPLPWLVQEDAGKDIADPPDTPQPEGPPEVEPTEHGIDLADSPIDAVDLASPIKKRMYAKLPEAVQVLARHGNRFVEVKGPTDILQKLVAVPFEEADLLDIHLQIMALSDVRDLNASKPEAERLDTDCVAALNNFLRLAPPVTMGHPDVDALEKALADYARQRLPATVPEGERRVASGIANSPEIAGDRLRRVAGQVSNAPDQGRVAEYRRSLHRNTVLALAYVAGAIGDSATGYVFGEVTTHAAQFLVLHKDAIMATAPAWGETGYRWLEYMLIRAQHIVDEARRK